MKDFCSEFSEDVTLNFLHDLEVTAGVLTDARTLSEKAKSVSTALQIDYRADALNIQIDDCVRELDVWMKIAKRLKKERGGKKQNVKLQFFNSFLTAISKSSRVSARQRMLEHQGNIRTTLAIFGRFGHLTQTRPVLTFSDMSILRTLLRYGRSRKPCRPYRKIYLTKLIK